MQTNISTLIVYRRKIDTLDNKLAMLLKQRMDLSRAVGKYKKVLGIKPLDKKRWHEVLKLRMSLGEKIGLDPVMIKNIYQVIHKYSLYEQR